MGAPLLSVLALVLALPGPLRDEGDDQYHYIVGLCERGLHERAVREADAFLESFPRHARRDSCRYRLATSLFELDRREEARQHLARLSRLSGFEFAPEVWFRLGQCELERGAFDAASQALQRARASDREYLRVPAEFLLGEADFRRERFGPAGEHYAAVLRAEDPAAAEYARDAGYGLCWCSFRLGQLDSAVERIEAFLERWPADPLAGELRLLLGEAHLESGRPEPALAEYRRVEEGPHRPAALRGAPCAPPPGWPWARRCSPRTASPTPRAPSSRRRARGRTRARGRSRARAAPACSRASAGAASSRGTTPGRPSTSAS